MIDCAPTPSQGLIKIMEYHYCAIIFILITNIDIKLAPTQR